MAKQEYIIAPSILSADFSQLGNENVLTAGADWVHFDVMDNHYVPNLTIGPMVCEALRKHGINAPIDVHLMVKPVDSLIETFAHAGATYITFHPEASDHVDRSLQLIKSKNCKAGLVLNPATSLSVLENCWDKLDMVLLMSVNPGFGGQKFMLPVLEKVVQSGKPLLIIAEVDGGINLENIGKAAEAGADTFVSGSAIFNEDNYQDIIIRMREALLAVS